MLESSDRRWRPNRAWRSGSHSRSPLVRRHVFGQFSRSTPDNPRQAIATSRIRRWPAAARRCSSVPGACRIPGRHVPARSRCPGGTPSTAPECDCRPRSSASGSRHLIFGRSWLKTEKRIREDIQRKVILRREIIRFWLADAARRWRRFRRSGACGGAAGAYCRRTCCTSPSRRYLAMVALPRNASPIKPIASRSVTFWYHRHRYSSAPRRRGSAGRCRRGWSTRTTVRQCRPDAHRTHRDRLDPGAAGAPGRRKRGEPRSASGRTIPPPVSRACLVS